MDAVSKLHPTTLVSFVLPEPTSLYYLVHWCSPFVEAVRCCRRCCVRVDFEGHTANASTFSCSTQATSIGRYCRLLQCTCQIHFRRLDRFVSLHSFYVQTFPRSYTPRRSRRHRQLHLQPWLPLFATIAPLCDLQRAKPHAPVPESNRSTLALFQAEPPRSIRVSPSQCLQPWSQSHRKAHPRHLLMPTWCAVLGANPRSGFAPPVLPRDASST